MLSGWERPSHWLVLAVVVVVLFGYKKLPDASRAVGRSLRIFKTELKGMNEDDANRDATAAVGEAPTSAPEAAPVVTKPAVQAVVEPASQPITPAAPVIQPLLMQQPAQLVDNPAPGAQTPK
jgi:sec-independent protein translocase protein TatA